jgi:hypothetical protein
LSFDRPGQPHETLPSLTFNYYPKLRKNASKDATSSNLNRKFTGKSALPTGSPINIQPLIRKNYMKKEKKDKLSL